MSHQDLFTLAVSLAVLLVMGVALGRLASKLGFPAIAGELIAGIMLGPTILTRFWPDFATAIFPSKGHVAAGRTSVIFFGLLCFLFAAGSEMHVRGFARFRRKILATSAFGLLVPFAVGGGSVLVFESLWSPHLPGGTLAHGALLIGTMLSISALPVIARILMDIGLFKHEVGTLIISTAIVNDVVGWLGFATVVGTGRDGRPLWSTFILLGGLVTVLVFALPRLIQKLNDSPSLDQGTRLAIAVSLLLLGGAAADWVGVHATLGAFLVGLAYALAAKPPSLANGVSLPPREDEAVEGLQRFATRVFAPMYFVSIGLRTDFVGNFNLPLTAFVLAIACVGKLLGVYAGARMSGMHSRFAWAAAFGLNARGAMEIVLATVALDMRLIDEKLHVAMVFMAIATSLISGPALTWLVKDERFSLEAASSPAS